MIRDATVDDSAAVARCYNPYVRETVITFEVADVAVEDMGVRIAKVLDAGLPWLVAVDSATAADAGFSDVLGFAYAAPFRDREAYRHSLEATVYLDMEARGRGIGTQLYAELFERLRLLDPATCKHAPVHRLYAGIALPNDASVAIHERFGFERTALYSEVGRKFDTWIDVGFWELDIEADF